MLKPRKIHWFDAKDGCEFSASKHGVLKTEIKEEVTCKVCNALLNNEKWAEPYRWVAYVMSEREKEQLELDGKFKVVRGLDYKNNPIITVKQCDAFAGFRGDQIKWYTYFELVGDEYELMKDKSDEEIIGHVKNIKKTIHNQ